MDHGRLFLSEDVLINVLSRLPVKTLLRFRCVCKRWRYLISDPHFIQIHSLQSKSKQPLLFFSSIPELSSERGRRSTFLKSTDREGNLISRFKFETLFVPGLLPTRFDLVCIHDCGTIHICNPSTHESIKLPESPTPLHSVGFGYVQSTDEYKVVVLANPDNPLLENLFEYGYPLLEDPSVVAAALKKKCHVFTLGMERRGSSSCSSSSSSWGWREVVGSPYQVNCSSPPAYVNGAIHWLVVCDSYVDELVYDGHMIDPTHTIVAFDVESEEFRLVPHPEGCPDLLEGDDYCVDSTEHQLVELRGLLCLSYTSDLFPESSKMDIWMFKDYYYESGNDHISGTWEKEYSIDLDILPRSYQKVGNIYLYYAPRDIEDTKLLIEAHSMALGYYHIQSTSFKEFMHTRRMRYLEFSFYMESLRSLKQWEQGKPLKQKQKKKRKANCLEP